MALKLTWRCYIWLEPSTKTVDTEYGMICKKEKKLYQHIWDISFYQMGNRNAQSTMAVISNQTAKYG